MVPEIRDRTAMKCFLLLLLGCFCTLSCEADNGGSGGVPPPPVIFNVAMKVTVKADGDFLFAITIKDADSSNPYNAVTLQNFAIIDLTKSPAYLPENSPGVPILFGDLAPGQSATKTIVMPRRLSHAYDKYIAIYRITYVGNGSNGAAGLEQGDLIGNYLPAR
jgi:hypothetical protein